MIIQILKDKLITWILRIKLTFLMNSLNCLIQSWIISMDKLDYISGQALINCCDICSKRKITEQRYFF